MQKKEGLEMLSLVELIVILIFTLIVMMNFILCKGVGEGERRYRRIIAERFPDLGGESDV